MGMIILASKISICPHFQQLTLVSFKCRILACYSPQVKEFMGRSAWDYDEFLTLEDAIPAVAGTYWIMSPFQTSYAGPARSQVPECPDNTGEGGLQRRIKAHKRILSQGSETILGSYSARHVLPTPILLGLGAANNTLYCHVSSKRSMDWDSAVISSSPIVRKRIVYLFYYDNFVEPLSLLRPGIRPFSGASTIPLVTTLLCKYLTTHFACISTIPELDRTSFLKGYFLVSKLNLSQTITKCSHSFLLVVDHSEALNAILYFQEDGEKNSTAS
ncbi:hypothetical protein J7T55_009311 [Diaporthe amygdali]|uniref:uncharacterized protein n=1 Tax=Phomopsis amygdali TaxID=1214568 RepID=UPI0022FDDFB1|nr:uncharacterized protein J7T55_009311 [Diaporthe amygdali]KAJ0118528.1 hypothetical protein J7T55_009311 [Diaporthe amygdali]